MARLFADEDFPYPVVERLRRFGHDVLTTLEAGRANQGIADPDQLVFAAGKDPQFSADKLEIRLTWTATSAQRFVIEGSDDLGNWALETVSIRETGPGRYEAVFSVNERHRYYRLRQDKE